MKLAPPPRTALALLLLLAATITPIACADADPTPTPQLISASLLIEPNPAAPQWFDLSASKGVDAYELLAAAVDGNLEADWYPAFRSHFVQSIQSVAPSGPQFWSVFLWNETASDGRGAWEPLPVGADLFSVKNGHIMAWALVEYDPNSPNLPQTLPPPGN